MIPGYITNYTFAGTEYQVFAYIEDTHGARTYLPSPTPKIRQLTLGLLSAHETRRLAAHEQPFEIKKLDPTGLIKSDNTSISHDFLLNSTLATEMAAAIGSSASKAQNVWNAVEKAVRDEISRPAAAPAPAAASPASAAPPAPAAASTPTLPSNPLAGHRKTSIDFSLRGFDLNQPDWYDSLSPRVKIRILNATLAPFHPHPALYRKVFERFPTITLIREEKMRLSHGLPTTPFRDKGEETIATFLEWEQIDALAFYDRDRKRQADALKISLQSKIDELKILLDSETAFKEQFLQNVREFAVAEGVAIADWDRDWAQHHYLEDNYRLVQALAFSLDSLI